MDDLSLTPRSPAERCPYCHDQLAGQEIELLVLCAGCGTQHHAVCLAELGRCTVLGCEKPEGHDLPAQLPALSGAARAIRKRIRQRVGNFVRRNVKAPPPEDLERLWRMKNFEDQVRQWLPDVLQEALDNRASYDREQAEVIRKVARKRRLLATPATFAGKLLEWPDEELTKALSTFLESYSIPERTALARELKRRGLKRPGS